MMNNNIRQSDRAFGFTFAVLFALIFVIVRIVFEIYVIWTLGLSLAFMLASLLSPGLLLPLNRVWAVIVGKLFRVNNHMLLGILFFLLVLPTGLLARLVGYDPMNKNKKETMESYWTTNDRHSNRDTLKDMF